MKKGKIAGVDTYDYKADGTEKTAEEKAAFMFNYQIEQSLKNFKEHSEEFKTLIALKEKVEKLPTVDAEVITKLRADLDAAGLQLKELKEKPQAKEGKTLSAVIKENKETIKKIAKGELGEKSEIVVPGMERKTLVQRSAIASDVQGYLLPDLGQLATRKLSLYDIFPKITISESNNSGVIRYRDWDQSTISRAAAAVAETGSFPESTAAFTMQSISLKKIGDTLPVTEEFFEDEDMFASELDLFLNINVALEIDRQLSKGDGTSNQITGLVSSVNAYTTPLSSFEKANIYDLILDVKATITKTGGAKYAPDFAVMNIVDINRMRSTKSTLGTYVIPPFVSPDGMNVAGVQIVESNIIDANTMVIGDRRFARIYEKGGITLSKGVVNAQFTADEMTLKARKRMLFLIRYADKGGFLKVTDIDAAVAALIKP